MKLHPNMNLDIRTQIAILYICTGKYNQFFHEFYTSCERYFLVDQAINKQYFVWTDDVSLCNADNVHLIYHACQGFPADSLFRFDMFLQKENELCSYDYIYFLMQMHSSANLLVKKFYQMIQVLLQLNGLDALLSQHCYIHMKGINNLKPISRRFIHRIGIIWGNQWGNSQRLFSYGSNMCKKYTG